MEEFYLVYENKGILTAFKVLARYIKGENFSAKIIEENKSRSFAYSMMYGVFSDRESAENLILELQKTKELNPRIEEIKAELAKLRTKLERLETQQEKLQEKIEKKNESEERLQEKEKLTDAQYEQFDKIEAALNELGKKEDELSDAYDALDGKINSLEDKRFAIEEESERRVSELWELKRKLCINKIESMGIEVRPETVKAPLKKPKIESIEVKSQKDKTHSKKMTTKKSFWIKFFGLISQ